MTSSGPAPAQDGHGAGVWAARIAKGHEGPVLYELVLYSFGKHPFCIYIIYIYNVVNELIYERGNFPW